MRIILTDTQTCTQQSIEHNQISNDKQSTKPDKLDYSTAERVQ